MIQFPIDGELDLHAFSPKDTVSVVDEYLRACHKKCIYEVKVIHGKGKGVLRRTVYSLLENHSLVLDYRLDNGPSGWGASIISLKRR